MSLFVTLTKHALRIPSITLKPISSLMFHLFHSLHLINHSQTPHILVHSPFPIHDALNSIYHSLYFMHSIPDHLPIHCTPCLIPNCLYIPVLYSLHSVIFILLTIPSTYYTLSHSSFYICRDFHSIYHLI